MSDSLYQPVLTIDFGASYTKIGFRSRSQKKQFVRSTTKVWAISGKTPMIPSLAIETGRARRPWVFGTEAADLVPGAETIVHRNWKAKLFQEELDDESAAAVLVAGHYFRWLREEIEKSGINLTGARIRLCVPAFRDIERNIRALATCLKMNGWRHPEILRVDEPHANVLGILTEGINHACFVEDGKMFVPRFDEMCGMNSPFVAALRQDPSRSGRQLVTWATIDIGSYTIDVATIRLDFDLSSQSSPDAIESTTQSSFRVGIVDHLETPMLTGIGENHGIDMSIFSFTQIEEMKKELLGGNEYPVLVRGRGEIVLGGEADREIVDQAIQYYVSKAWEAISARVNAEKPERVLFTGGGSLIEQVRKHLDERLGAHPISCEGSFFPEPQPKVWREWHETDDALARLATALGGSSILLDLEARPGDAEPMGTNSRPQPIDHGANLKPCTCNGGNKDCCFCFGRGFVE